MTGFLDIFYFIVFLFFELFLFLILWDIKPKIKFLLKLNNPNLMFWLFMLFVFTLWCQINLTYVLRVIGFQVEDDPIRRLFTVINLLLITFAYLTFNKKK